MAKAKVLLVLLAMLLGSTANAGFDETKLGRLFTDKQQRKLIDDKRLGRHQQRGPVKTTRRVTVKGYMKRSKGKTVVWVNGKSTLNKNAIEDVRVQSGRIKNNQVTVSVNGKKKKLKPGESWVPESGVGATSPVQ